MPLNWWTETDKTYLPQIPGFRCGNETSGFASELHWGKITLIFLNGTEHKAEDRNAAAVFLLRCPPIRGIVPDAWVEFGRMNKYLAEDYGPALMR